MATHIAFQAHFYPQAITETILEGLPASDEATWKRAPATIGGIGGGGVRRPRPASRSNMLERLWAYLTINDLLKRVARGDMSSCDYESDQHGKGSERRQRRTAAAAVAESDDEDYSTDEGSGANEYELEEDGEDSYYGDLMDDVLEELGDADVVICDNLERALYLSLKYEFVTPLTSLVVVAPGERERRTGLNEIDGGAAGPPADITIFSRAGRHQMASEISFSLAVVVLVHQLLTFN